MHRRPSRPSSCRPSCIMLPGLHRCIIHAACRRRPCIPLPPIIPPVGLGLLRGARASPWARGWRCGPSPRGRHSGRAGGRPGPRAGRLGGASSSSGVGDVVEDVEFFSASTICQSDQVPSGCWVLRWRSSRTYCGWAIGGVLEGRAIVGEHLGVVEGAGDRDPAIALGDFLERAAFLLVLLRLLGILLGGGRRPARP